jgi:hypothetical protein
MVPAPTLVNNIPSWPVTIDPTSLAMTFAPVSGILPGGTRLDATVNITCTQVSVTDLPDPNAAR